MMSRRTARTDIPLDNIFCVYKEKIAGAGEDSFCYQMGEQKLLLGAFDGCGGSGARKYAGYRNRTGAYIASRAVAGAVQWLFDNDLFTDDGEENARRIHDVMVKSLAVCKAHSGAEGSSKLRGSMAKAFPTTAAIVLCTARSGAISLDCYWAGDSRVYLLDEDGLAQITDDDLDGLDAYENISGDGVLTNVVSADKSFQVHFCRVSSAKPFLVFAATDGCFGYIPTPMEFESFLLENLFAATSMAQFERRISRSLEKIAGDDYTLAGAAFGYETFPALQQALLPRGRRLQETYIQPLEGASEEAVLALWQRYRQNYSRYLFRR